MTVAICDDEKNWLEYASRVLDDYGRRATVSIDIVPFSSGKALLSYGEKPIDAVFIDIEMEDENGIEIVSQLNEQWPDCQVAYCTDYLHYAMDVYETRHSYFIVKSHFQERIDTIMSRLITINNMKKQEVFYHVIKTGMTRFAVNDILYFERKTRMTTLTTVNGACNIREKITEVIRTLPEGEFTRSHASFVVNLAHIVRKNGSAYELDSGASVPISRSFSKASKEDYLRWCSARLEERQ